MIRCANSDVEAYLAEVRAEADKRGIREKLEKRLKYLEEYGNSLEEPFNTECILFKDFSPLSFEFRMNKRATGQMWFCGGLIFHGRHDGFGSGSAPTFAVTLEAVDEDWSIHT